MVTDHKLLLAILGPKNGIPSLAAARLQRWAILLSAYQYEIQFKPTAMHADADGLSRLSLPEHTDNTSMSRKTTSMFNIAQIEAVPITSSEIRSATKKHKVLSKVYYYTKQGWPDHISDLLKAYHQCRDKLMVEGDCLMWGIHVIIPRRHQSHVLKELHQDHPGSLQMKSLARSYVWWPGMDKDIENTAKSCVSCQQNKHSPSPAPMHPWSWPVKPWQ